MWDAVSQWLIANVQGHVVGREERGKLIWYQLCQPFLEALKSHRRGKFKRPTLIRELEIWESGQADKLIYNIGSIFQ